MHCDTKEEPKNHLTMAFLKCVILDLKVVDICYIELAILIHSNAIERSEGDRRRRERERGLRRINISDVVAKTGEIP